MCRLEREEACDECTKKCLEMHGRKPPAFPPRDPSRPLSFFKIMIGDFREAMFVPPKVARTVDGLVNQNVTLEDSGGLSWIVKVSLVGESLVFKDGWREFVLDHSIEVGEIVVFTQIRRSFFYAQVYSTSACERFDFHEKCNTDMNTGKKNSEKGFPIISSCHTNQSSDPSEEDCMIVGEVSVRKKRTAETDECSATKKRVVEIASCELTVVETIPGKAAIQCKARAMLSNSPAHNDNSSRRSKSMNYSDGPVHTTDEDVVPHQDTSEISPLSLGNEEVEQIMTVNSSSLNPDYCGVAPDTPVECNELGEVPLHECNKDAKDGKEISVRFPFSLTASDNAEAQGGMVSEDTMCVQANVVSPTTLPAVDTFGASFSAQDTNNLIERDDIISNDHDKHAIFSTIPALERTVCEATTLPDFDTHGALSSAQDTNNLVEGDNIISNDHDDHAIFSTILVEHTVCEAKNETAASWDIIVYPHKGKERFEPVCLAKEKEGGEDPMLKQDRHCRSRRGRRRHREKANCANAERNAIMLDEYVHTILVTEEGICHKSGGDLANNVGSSTTNPIELCDADKCESVCLAYRGSFPRKPCPQHEPGLVALAVEDEKRNCMSSCDAIGDDPLTAGNLNPLGDIQAPELRTEDASITGKIVNASCTVPGTCTPDKEVDESGKVPEVFLEVEDQKVASSQYIKTIKTEVTDSIDLPAPNSAKMSFSLVSDNHSSIELPEKLPYRLSKRLNGRKVVLLRDPFTRLWPVLYHESNKFVGLIGGWNSFASANKLQQGDKCVLELVEVSEPTFQVYISKA